jgi:hypothetical protein
MHSRQNSYSRVTVLPSGEVIAVGARMQVDWVPEPSQKLVVPSPELPLGSPKPMTVPSSAR